MGKTYEEKLERHIKALDTAYENIIEVLESEIKTKKDETTGEEEIKLSDAQIKTYAEGLERSTKTANLLLSEIKAKTDELEEIRNIKQDAPVPESKDGETKLSSRLQ